LNVRVTVPTLTIALDRYDRHVPLFLGEVAPPADWRYRKRRNSARTSGLAA
jgi:hypothetical protein